MELGPAELHAMDSGRLVGPAAAAGFTHTRNFHTLAQL